MSIRVLGCAGSIARGCRTTAFLLDDDVLIDAGSGVGDLELSELVRIDHVLLTHAHLDHVLALPLLADSVMRKRVGRPPIQVHALPQTLDVLRLHLFNDQLWPDFTRLPCPNEPILELVPLAVGQRLRVGARERAVQVLPAAHSVPAVGYAVSGRQGAWVYTGDTGPNPELWQALRGQTVRQLVIEVAFPESGQSLAAESGHHCPSSLVEELRLVPPGVEVRLTHIKPGELDAVRADLARRWPDAVVHVLRTGQRIGID